MYITASGYQKTPFRLLEIPLFEKLERLYQNLRRGGRAPFKLLQAPFKPADFQACHRFVAIKPVDLDLCARAPFENESGILLL
jgi:hypothetical protein